jgi:hypothetical protein
MDALLNKVEIIFWDRITPALSESRFFQAVVKKGYSIINNQEIEATLLWGIGAGVLGLVSGLILSIISGMS